jgi:hypothetical protein
MLPRSVFLNAWRMCGKRYALVVVGYVVMQEHAPKGPFSPVDAHPAMIHETLRVIVN